jgi:small subunit ribosomal protein S16
MGAKKSPFYRIVIKEKRSKRDGKYLENVGTYNPMTEPAEINLKHDRIQYWLSVGAQPTETVASLIKHNPEQTEEEKAIAVQTRAEKREADRQAKLDAKKAESAKREEERLAAEKAETEKAEAEAAEAKAAEDAANAEVAAEDTEVAETETETSEAEQPAETTGDETEAKEGE